MSEQELEQLFSDHAIDCKKGNKCCFSPANGSTQEFIAVLANLITKAVTAARREELRLVLDTYPDIPARKVWADRLATLEAEDKVN